MRALVVYESMYGNTHAVATDIAAGLSAAHEVTLVPVTRASRVLVAGTDLIVAGAPTHRHGMPTIGSRRMAAETGREADSGLTMDPDADGPGLRAWLEELNAEGVLAAAFDTRLGGLPALTGRASRPIARLLTRRGCRVLLAPESFLVSGQNTLLDGEDGRACSWGAQVGEAARDVWTPSRLTPGKGARGEGAHRRCGCDWHRIRRARCGRRAPGLGAESRTEDGRSGLRRHVRSRRSRRARRSRNRRGAGRQRGLRRRPRRGPA